jgi:hypothetical protein
MATALLRLNLAWKRYSERVMTPVCVCSKETVRIDHGIAAGISHEA